MGEGKGEGLVCVGFLFLILEINPLHAVADGRQNLVWYGVEGIAEDGDGEVVAEDFDTVAFLTIDAGDINHRYVHTDVTNIRCLLTIDQTIAVAVAQVAVQTVRITDWDGSNHTVVVDFTLTRVANGVASWYVAHLKNRCLQC